jgi:isochorismate hydrolase
VQALLKNKIFWYIVIAVIVILAVYFVGKKFGVIKAAVPDIKPLPNNGQGIPTGWTAEIVAQQIYDAMFGGLLWGMGSDEDKIFDTLTPLTDDQLAATYNTYNTMFHSDGSGTLISDFQSELSGDDLTRVLSYFNSVI